jgi:hypothetical protein
VTIVDLPDPAAAADLRTFAARARRLDDAAAVRLVAAGPVLAVYACALYGPGTPTTLALRVGGLAAAATVDETVPAAALVDRLALADRRARTEPPGAPVRVELPPFSSSASTPWAGVQPPRGGWTGEGELGVEVLRAAARAGIEEVAAGTPAVAGAAAVARLRAAVWGRPLPGGPGGAAGLPAGVAFAAEAFGFLGRGAPAEAEDAVTLYRNARWWRLSTSRGHVLVRPPSGL